MVFFKLGGDGMDLNDERGGPEMVSKKIYFKDNIIFLVISLKVNRWWSILVEGRG